MSEFRISPLKKKKQATEDIPKNSTADLSKRRMRNSVHLCKRCSELKWGQCLVYPAYLQQRELVIGTHKEVLIPEKKNKILQYKIVQMLTETYFFELYDQSQD